jgi:lipopolysaccharide export system permease protein
VFRIADRYIITQITKPLATALAVGLLVLLAERLVRLLDTTLGKKNSFGVVFEMLAYLLPHYLGLAIPAALFLGLLYGFNRMSRNSEVDAFYASGVGLHRLAQPVALFALLFAIASVLILGWVQPHARYAYRSVVFDITNVDVFYLAEEGVFMQAGTRTFILDHLDRQKGAFDGIFLFDDNGADGGETVTAPHGELLETPNSALPVLRLDNGHRLQIKPWPSLEPGTEPPSAVASNFDSAETPLGKISNKGFRPRGEDERELTLPELIATQDSPPVGTTRNQMTAELHKRLVNMLIILVLPVLALPFALGRRRNQRTYRFGIALIILIAFHEIVERGAIATATAGTSPWLTMWLPFVVIAAFALWRFWQACFVLKSDTLEGGIDRLVSMIAGFFSRFRRAPA